MTYLVRISMLALAVFSARPVLAANPSQTPPPAPSKSAELKPEEQAQAAAFFDRAVAQVSGTLQQAATSVQDGTARERATHVAEQIQKDVAAFDREFMKMTAPQRLWILDQMIATVKTYHGLTPRERTQVFFWSTLVTIVLVATFVVHGIAKTSDRNLKTIISLLFGGGGVLVAGYIADDMYFDKLPVLQKKLESLRAVTANEVVLNQLSEAKR